MSEWKQISKLKDGKSYLGEESFEQKNRFTYTLYGVPKSVLVVAKHGISKEDDGLSYLPLTLKSYIGIKSAFSSDEGFFWLKGLSDAELVRIHFHKDGYTLFGESDLVSYKEPVILDDGTFCIEAYAAITGGDVDQNTQSQLFEKLGYNDPFTH